MVDAETCTYSFGEIPAKRESMMEDAEAPEFELTDRQGKVVRMSDYKGKKALIISAAQDTGGEAVAGPIFDAAGAEYVQIVDENHTISSVFNFVNVPTLRFILSVARISMHRREV